MADAEGKSAITPYCSDSGVPHAMTTARGAVLTVASASAVLSYVVGVVEAGSAAPWPPCAATDSGCHWLQVASRDS